jgi:hypothetical protein
MGFWHLIRSWWRHRQRRIDLQILWPSLRAQTSDLEHARRAFAAHALHEPAWLELGEETIDRITGKLL